MAATAQRRRATHHGFRRRGREAVDLWVDLFDQHNLLTYASAIARQTLVAAVALVLLGLGLVHAAGRDDLWDEHFGPQIEQRVLVSVYGGINDTVGRIFEKSSPWLIIFAVVVAIREVSGGVRACIGALDQVYETKDDRPWWIRFPLSFGLSLCLIAGLIGAILLIVVAGGAVQGSWAVPFAIVRWVGAIVLLSAAFTLLVRFAPAERRGKEVLDELLRKDAPDQERAIHQHVAGLARTVRRRS